MQADTFAQSVKVSPAISYLCESISGRSPIATVRPAGQDNHVGLRVPQCMFDRDGPGMLFLYRIIGAHRKRRANRQGFQSEFLGLARFDWAIGQGAERTVDGNQHVPASSVFNGDAGHIFSRFGNYIPIEQILVKREQ